MIDSLRYIDFRHVDLAEEVYATAQLSKGGFTYSECRDMPWDIYETVIKRTMALQDEIKKEMNEINNE